MVNKTINQGMIQTIKQDIIPRLDQNVPIQPTAEELQQPELAERGVLLQNKGSEKKS